MAKTANGILLPLHVLSNREKAISPEARMQQRQLLETAETLAHAANAQVETIGRVDDAIDRGIIRTAIERNASLVVVGWKGYSTYQENFFGSTIDNIALELPIPVLITRFVQPIANSSRVFLAITKKQVLSSEFIQTLTIAKLLASALKASLQVLVVISNKQTKLTPSELTFFSSDLVITQIQGNFIKIISEQLNQNDLLLMPIQTSAKRLRQRSVIGSILEAIARSHPEISILIIHFPD